MPYLSKILINPRRRDGQALLTNPHIAHGMVIAGLPDPIADRPLWRIDTDNPHRPHLLTLTRNHPDWTHITEQAGWPASDIEQVTIRDYTTLLAHLRHGRQFAFRLTANPTQNLKNPQKPSPSYEAKTAGQSGRHRGQRVAHRTAAQQLTWFLDHCQRWGFTVPDARSGPLAPHATELPRNIRLTARELNRFQKTTDSPTITVATATFEGILTITDPDALRISLIEGIGPAKAYGCGLLTLAPVPVAAANA